MSPNPPVVAGRGARLYIARDGQDRSLLNIVFDELAFILEIDCFWEPFRRPAILIVEAYNGLKLVERTGARLDTIIDQMTFRIETIEGMTSALVRLERLGGHDDEDHDDHNELVDWIEFLQVRYCTLREEFDMRAGGQKCMAQEKRVLEGGGKLAWLPNHDYEISLTTKVILEYAKVGSQEAHVKQKAFFRTKGLPGLNAVVRIGEELEKFVESRYPGASPRTIYRSEPIVLAFNENFNVLLPVDRSPSQDNPDELNQILEWALVVEKFSIGTGEPTDFTN